MEKRRDLLGLYIKTQLWTYTWLEKRGGLARAQGWAESPSSMQIDGFDPLRVYKPETHSVFEHLKPKLFES